MGNRLVLGLFIGYALGLLSAMGMWMMLSSAPSPFIPQERSGTGAETAADPVQKNASASGIEGGSDVRRDRPRFEFYKMLPDAEEQLPVGQEFRQAGRQPSSDDRYFLQAGSFQSSDEADNLKAKLAMLGVEASVQSADLSEKGVWHRVRVGPFTSMDDIDRVRASLQQNGVQSSLMKAHDSAP
ncbi:Sporulation related domain-containing protein [Nitrosovibrio sp. Nv17]|jgi:cell division protein FtsN|nr:Sporulation related domain-containing protein [Nitrosovibrio sp. Nv17]